jgi:ABC-2 type transport system ATP-binding protein
MPEHDCLPSELAGDYGSFTRALPRIALRERIRVRQVLPSDESLESVFSDLVGAR